MTQRRRIGLLQLAGLCFLWNMGLAARGPDCPPPPSAGQRRALEDYVQKRYKLPKTIVLTLQKDSLVGDTCYRELNFQGVSHVRTWDLTLYASPDFRFLSGELFDTQRDPVEEERLNSEALMAGLTRGGTAARGPAKAAVTIVEFSDFQCPYCRKFAGILNEVLSSGSDDVRAVFHHLPLAMHPWARQAAETAACAQLQSGAAFWALHDQIFQNQGAITAENAKEKLDELAKGTKGLDATAFQQCMDNGMSVGLVLKDMNLAEVNHVNGTPTLFINGHRLEGVENAAKLRELIAESRKESASNASVPESDSAQTARKAASGAALGVTHLE